VGKSQRAPDRAGIGETAASIFPCRFSRTRRATLDDDRRHCLTVNPPCPTIFVSCKKEPCHAFG
jgi:hypothetical protein